MFITCFLFILLFTFFLLCGIIFILNKGVVILKFVVSNLNPNSNVVSVFVNSLEDLLAYIPIYINPDVSQSTLYRVKEFAVYSVDLFFISRKYLFFVRKVV